MSDIFFRELSDELNEAFANADLTQRLRLLRDKISGRIVFTTSLGIEDQAITHAIAATGAAIDIFTLDTGRLFPETLDTLFETEGKYGLKICVMFPDVVARA